MNAITALDPQSADGKVADLLGAVAKSLGSVPNLFRVAAQSPASLEGLLALSSALRTGRLSGRTREALALTVAELNGCDYCLSAHTLLGKGAGLSDADIEAARQGRSADTERQAALDLAAAVVRMRGRVADADLARARQAGLDDGQIVEIVAQVVLNTFTNYLNLVARTEIDFPVVKTLPRQAA
ncbi:peroxidase [Prosthecomicrobium hirschii]|uniref:carboxymuconolactone decarboxylase family protein n=1 Tax=Prosthecodimorpha hirschii TaxID=665126 RepID=UPI00112A883F|nr:carboxymuconolactone decarboxylase family protein [Prosthecomicrobium hirschii]TPQ52013.1 peroxidase [Prosthecomicrobium hirschii]